MASATHPNGTVQNGDPVRSSNGYFADTDYLPSLIYFCFYLLFSLLDNLFFYTEIYSTSKLLDIQILNYRIFYATDQ